MKKDISDTYYRVIDKDISKESHQLLEKLIESIYKDLEGDGVDEWAIPIYIEKKAESMLSKELNKVI